MELVIGAMGSLIPKLKDLLKEEYKLQTGSRIKSGLSSWSSEVPTPHSARWPRCGRINFLSIACLNPSNYYFLTDDDDG
jgi:hypothetical protein